MTAPVPIKPPARSYKGPERRQEFDDWRVAVDQRLDSGAETMKGLREDLAQNTAATLQVQTDTSELVSLIKSFKGLFKLLDLLGRAMKPIGYIAMACGSLWALATTIKGGGSPK